MTGAVLVSVLMPCRDAAATLGEALASLAAQRGPAIEIVAVDDGSRDATPALLDAFAATHSGVRVLRTPGIGIAGALAAAARAARGELLARQDADDLSRPERLERQVAFLTAHPSIGVLGTGADVLDDAGRVTGRYPVPIDPVAIRRVLRRAPPFVHGSVMMRRSAYEAAGGYRPAFPASQDLDLWLRLPPETGLANLAEPLYAWRRHAGGVTGRSRERQLSGLALARAFAEERAATGRDSYAAYAAAGSFEAFLPQYARAARLAALLGEAFVRDGRVREGRRWLTASLRREPHAMALGWWALSWPVAFAPRARRARAHAAAAALATERSGA